jgi:hypothetical protein
MHIDASLIRSRVINAGAITLVGSTTGRFAAMSR